MKEAENIDTREMASRLEGCWELAIVGGGLAGLALSIQSARAGFKTILIEKESYPFHRVCGEYISLESWNFLEELGIPLSDMKLPQINRLLVSAPGGKYFEQTLPLGGFGISRYLIDHSLANLARTAGVKIIESTRVNGIDFDNDQFTVHCLPGKADSGFTIHSKMCCAAHGKRSNLDVKWNRDFIIRKENRLNNYVGVKYHVRFNSPQDLISLHNFQDGYCGISKIEEEKYCLCYLTRASNLKNNQNSIRVMENEILKKNPFLKEIFENAVFIYDQPKVISQISFDKKTLIEDHVIMIGDAAGMIAPLCGNGMSMALHASKLAFVQIARFLRGESGRIEMEELYKKQWKTYFAKRLRIGRLIQYFFGNPFLSNILINSLKPFPGLRRQLIRQTHGEPF